MLGSALAYQALKIKHVSLFLRPSILGAPENFNFWGEEEARQLYELLSNEVIDRRLRREKACKGSAFFWIVQIFSKKNADESAFL